MFTEVVTSDGEDEVMSGPVRSYAAPSSRSGSSIGPLCIAEDRSSAQGGEEQDAAESLHHAATADHWHRWHFHYPSMDVPPPAVAIDVLENDEIDDVEQSDATSADVGGHSPPVFQTLVAERWSEDQQHSHGPLQELMSPAVASHAQAESFEIKDEDEAIVDRGKGPANEAAPPVPPSTQTVTADRWGEYKQCHGASSSSFQQQRPPTEHEEIIVHRVWKVSSKKLTSKDTFLTSHEIEFWKGLFFMVILRPYPRDVRGGFKGSNGVGKVELKLCGGSQLSEKTKIYFRVAAGKHKELPFQELEHNFASQPLGILPHEWEFLSAVDSGVLLLHLEARMETEGI